MPTGYTAKMYDGESQTFAEFVLSCARNFGALITLRDSPEAEIPEQFKPSSYHREKMADAEADLLRWQMMSDDEVDADLRSEQERVETARKDIVVSARERESRYREMLAQVEAWTPPTDSHNGLKEFMAQQITESIQFDCSTKRLPTAPDVGTDTWRQNRTKKAQEDIAYHAKYYAEECERVAERNAWVKALRDSLETP